MSSPTFMKIGLFNGSEHALVPHLQYCTKFYAVINILTDFLLALLPIPLIWKLQIPLRTRLTLVLILSLGLFAAVAGIIRQNTMRDSKNPEPLIHDSYAIWSFIELDTGIIAASLPALKPLFNKFFDTMRSTIRSFHRATHGTNDGHHNPYRLNDGGNFTMATLGTHSTNGVTGVHSEIQPQGNNKKSVFDQSNGSTESILPRAKSSTKAGGIMVTKQFQME